MWTGGVTVVRWLGELIGGGGGEVGSDACGDGDCRYAAYHDPPEESLIAELLLNPSGRHPGNHHAESHEAGADGIVGCF